MIKQVISFECDQCGVNFMIDDSMEAPPGWLVFKIDITNTNGYFNNHEEEFNHFCTVKCALAYLNSQKFKERELMANYNIDDNEETEDDTGDESV